MKKNWPVKLLVCWLVLCQPNLLFADNAVEQARESIDRVVQWNDELRAVITINPRWLEQARALDLLAKNGQSKSPLHGWPVFIKDNIDVKGMPNTAGSLALATSVPAEDAPLVAQLRSAGLLIVAKTNLSEWANFRSERSSSGWSGVGGQARNPYAVSRSPCGSSSGSAVAVAAGMAPLAIGTETNGSIICPAAVNGIVGIKPTVGLVSQKGIIPISHSQDTAGPMATNVHDAAQLLSAMVTSGDRDYADSLDPSALPGKRIGVVRSLAGFHEGVDKLFEQAILDLQAAGATVVDGLSFENRPENMGQASYDVLLYEFKHGLNEYLAQLDGDGPTSLEDLIEFNQANAEKELRWFGQEIFLLAQSKGGLDDPEYLRATAMVKPYHQQAIDSLLEEHNLDALISPSNGPAWSIDRITGDHFLGGSSSYPARAGYPHITVPMGFVEGLPIGLSFYATAHAETTLINLAYAYEQRTSHARPPQGYGQWRLSSAPNP